MTTQTATPPTHSHSFLSRQLKFPPFLTLYAGCFALWAWCGYVYGPANPSTSPLGLITAPMLATVIPLWVVLTICFYTAARQRPVSAKITGWTGLAFSIFSLMLTIAAVSGR